MKDQYANLSAAETMIAKAIIEQAKSTLSEFPGDKLYLDGETFFSPKEWTDKGGEYGCGSSLIVVHEGDLGRFFSYDRRTYSYIQEMVDALEAIGYYAEGCTSWYTAIYKIN